MAFEAVDQDLERCSGIDMQRRDARDAASVAMVKIVAHVGYSMRP